MQEYKIGKTNSLGVTVWLIDHNDDYLSYGVQAAYQEAAKRTRMSKDGSTWVIAPIEVETISK